MSLVTADFALRSYASDARVATTVIDTLRTARDRLTAATPVRPHPLKSLVGRLSELRARRRWATTLDIQFW
ncbi:hypothetical protein [Protaetiibacter intestinalis]|uniref:hypothetical protein n=1 Tax=Protaetiibacter intestinalis TaxID=2419774 RepID=UPI0014730DB2|nr:hypothetical protein [Protaetiibacter intestinalis]